MILIESVKNSFIYCLFIVLLFVGLPLKALNLIITYKYEKWSHKNTPIVS